MVNRRTSMIVGSASVLTLTIIVIYKYPAYSNNPASHSRFNSSVDFQDAKFKYQLHKRLNSSKPWVKPSLPLHLAKFKYQLHKRLNSSKHWVKPSLPLHLQTVGQNDTRLIEHIRQRWLIPPSEEPRRLKKPNRVHYSQNGQSELVDEILKGRTNGFYVECGAYDGELISNSLYFEKSRNWSGLLIEANDRLFQSLLKHNRHAYLVNTCVSPESRPVGSPFVLLGPRLDGLGGLTKYMSASHRRRMGGLEKHMLNVQQVQCLPLYSILQAVGVQHVDYWSLDIEGAELSVLKTLPLDEITVDVISVEYVVGGTNGLTSESQEKLHAIKEHLVGRYDYEVVKISQTEDILLKRKGIWFPSFIITQYVTCINIVPFTCLKNILSVIIISYSW